METQTLPCPVVVACAAGNACAISPWAAAATWVGSPLWAVRAGVAVIDEAGMPVPPGHAWAGRSCMRNTPASTAPTISSRAIARAEGVPLTVSPIVLPQPVPTVLPWGIGVPMISPRRNEVQHGLADAFIDRTHSPIPTVHGAHATSHGVSSLGLRGSASCCYVEPGDNPSAADYSHTNTPRGYKRWRE